MGIKIFWTNRIFHRILLLFKSSGTNVSRKRPKLSFLSGGGAADNRILGNMHTLLPEPGLSGHATVQPRPRPLLVPVFSCEKALNA